MISYVRNKKTSNFWIGRSKVTWDIFQNSNSELLSAQATLTQSPAIYWPKLLLSDAKHLLSTLHSIHRTKQSNPTWITQTLHKKININPFSEGLRSKIECLLVRVSYFICYVIIITNEWRFGSKITDSWKLAFV